MDKRERILDALQALFLEGRGGTASVSDIAKKAGIAKGGLYYYFRSKEEVLDALVERQYESIIRRCGVLVEQSGANAVSKLAMLLRSYRASFVDGAMDACLHAPDNAAIHQKSLAKILNSLSVIVARILTQGIQEGLFACDNPQESAEIVLSVFTFLLDPGIFTWTPAQVRMKMQALGGLLEKGLCAPHGSFSFLHSETEAHNYGASGA